MDHPPHHCGDSDFQIKGAQEGMQTPADEALYYICALASEALRSRPGSCTTPTVFRGPYVQMTQLALLPSPRFPTPPSSLAHCWHGPRVVWSSLPPPPTDSYSRKTVGDLTQAVSKKSLFFSFHFLSFHFHACLFS